MSGGRWRAGPSRSPADGSDHRQKDDIRDWTTHAERAAVHDDGYERARHDDRERGRRVRRETREDQEERADELDRRLTRFGKVVVWGGAVIVLLMLVVANLTEGYGAYGNS